jgi:hypothetical protein
LTIYFLPLISFALVPVLIPPNVKYNHVPISSILNNLDLLFDQTSSFMEYPEKYFTIETTDILNKYLELKKAPDYPSNLFHKID